ncbi:hypothetical protein [Sphingomicrobium astaxanthinifaciens]|nr:hypothetical protein [Sphingomicrobium astaxanthinifaciens]
MSRKLRRGGGLPGCLLRFLFLAGLFFMLGALFKLGWDFAS